MKFLATVPAFAPIIFFVAIFLVILLSQAKKDWRESFLFATLVWGAFLTLMTEALSIFGLVAFPAVLGFWVLFGVVTTIYLIRLRGKQTKLNLRINFSSVSRLELFIIAAAVLIIAVVGLVALVSPPNTWDSMTYHLSRVMHWSQNGSVSHYPTHITNQLFMSPWSEFAILHFQILTGTDGLANLVQWFSMLASTLGISLIAKQLGASLRGQIFAAVIGVTIPMGILQGSGSQADYVVSFWLVCLVYFTLLLKKVAKPYYSIAVGASLGFAILTKQTAYIFALPFMAWVCFSFLRSRNLIGLLMVFLAVIIAFVINLGHFTRNYTLFRSPLGTDNDVSLFSNVIYTLPSISSNLIRNASLHMSTLPKLNAILENGIRDFHKFIGVDPNDRRITWLDTQFRVRHLSTGEDNTGNPLHFLLFTVSIPFLLLQRPKDRVDVRYLICLVSGFFIFCLLLKWQPYHSRLHLPLFILWSPLAGLLLSRVRNKTFSYLIILVLLFGSLPWLLYNRSRPLLGPHSILFSSRSELYFRRRPNLYGPYSEAATIIKNSGCSDIGLVLGIGDWEYPFWVLLNGNKESPFRIESVNVENESRLKYLVEPFRSFRPCALLVVNSDPPADFQNEGFTYLREWSSSPVSVFFPQ